MKPEWKSAQFLNGIALSEKHLICQTQCTYNRSTAKVISRSPNLCHQIYAIRKWAARCPAPRRGSSSMFQDTGQEQATLSRTGGCHKADQGTHSTARAERTCWSCSARSVKCSQTLARVCFSMLPFPSASFHISPIRATLSWTEWAPRKHSCSFLPSKICSWSCGNLLVPT